MFRIHDAQMEFFNRRERAMYLQRLQTYLEAKVPQSFDEMTSEEVRDWVEQAVETCDGYGIKSELATTQFVLLLLVLGAEPEKRYPWFEPIVTDRDYHGDHKVIAIIREALRADVEGVLDVVIEPTWVTL